MQWHQDGDGAYRTIASPAHNHVIGVRAMGGKLWTLCARCCRVCVTFSASSLRGMML